MDERALDRNDQERERGITILAKCTSIAWQDAAPNSVLENLYGPTELTIACLLYRWDRERSAAE